jgi:hypothetical protein
MPSYLQYWMVVGILAAFGMVTPVYLVSDGLVLQGVLIALPTLAVLALFVSITHGWLRQG